MFSALLFLSCFFYATTDVGNLISGSYAFSKSSWYIWMFSIQILMKPSLKDFEHNLTIMWNECNCMVVWTFFGIVFLRDWNDNWHFPVLCPLLSFPNLLAYWVHISLQSNGLSRVFSNTTVQKHQFFRGSAFFTVQLSHPYVTTGKTIALSRRTFVGKVMSLLLNMLSRLVITFLPRSKCPLISWLQSPSTVILE